MIDRARFYRVDLIDSKGREFGTTFGTVEEALDFIDSAPLTLAVRFSTYLRDGTVFGSILPAIAPSKATPFA